MTEDSPKDASRDDGLPQAVLRTRNVWSLQIIWIVPLVAALVGGWIAWQTYRNRGPTITVYFKSAEGLEAGKTRIKFKDVDIGTVMRVELSDDRAAVKVEAEMVRQVNESFLVDDTRFWIVRPRLVGGQVSGLGTLLSGSYIGADPGRSPNERREFTGLETAPVVTTDAPGRRFHLRAEDLGSLEQGSPVYFRRKRVGQVISADVTPDGAGVDINVFVESPFDRYVHADSKFWHASGVDVSLTSEGLHVQTQSIVSVLLGAVAFESPAESSQPQAQANASFQLYDNRADALRAPDVVTEKFVMVFDQSVRGLQVGAPVDFRGVTIGEVTRIGVDFNRSTLSFRTPVEINLYPERLRSRYRRGSDTLPAPNQLDLQRFIDRGFRGQLRTGNLVTGQLYIATDFFKGAPPVKTDPSRNPPEIPTIPGSFEELQTALANVVKRLEKVPFDQIGNDLRTALVTLDGTLKKTDQLVQRLDSQVAPQLQATVEQARKTLETAQEALSSDAPVQADLRNTLRDVSRATETVRRLADYLERHPESLLRGKQEETQP